MASFSGGVLQVKNDCPLKCGPQMSNICKAWVLAMNSEP